MNALTAIGVVAALGGVLLILAPLAIGLWRAVGSTLRSFRRMRVFERLVVASFVGGLVVYGATKPVSLVNVKTYAGKYDGQPHHAEITVTRGNAVVTNAVVYSMSPDGPFTYELIDFVDVGRYDIYYQVTTPERGTRSGSCRCTITPKKLTEEMVPQLEPQPFTGYAVTPPVDVADGDILKPSDYELAYSDNVNLGRAQVTITAVNNYTGVVTRTFSIVAPFGGKVTPPASWRVGRTAVWRAVADAGSVFAGWSGAEVDRLGLTENELRNPRLTLVVPADFDPAGITGKFISVESDALYSLGLECTKVVRGEQVSFSVRHDSRSYVTARVSGLPAGLRFNAAKLRIEGAARKAGNYVVKISATNASGYAWSENVLLQVVETPDEVLPGVVPTAPARKAYYPLTLLCRQGEGTLSGGGVYPEGKVVRITATPAKGMAFAGWYQDTGMIRPATDLAADYREPSQKVTVEAARSLFARFVPAEAARASLKVKLGAEGLAAGGKLVATVGVKQNIPIAVESLAATKVTVSGLVSGLRYDAQARAIVGVPTSAVKERKLVVRVTTAGAVQTFNYQIEVEALPKWIYGTAYSGGGSVKDEPGVSSVSVSKLGRVSGKILLKSGATWVITAGSLAVRSSERAFAADVTIRRGRETYFARAWLWLIDVGLGDGLMAARCRLEPEEGESTEVAFDCWQSVFQNPEYAERAAQVKGQLWTIDTDQGELEFKCGAKGRLTVRGVFDGVAVSASAQLLQTGINGHYEPEYSTAVRLAARGKFKGLVWSGVLNYVEAPTPTYPGNVVTTTLDVVDPNDGVTSLREALSRSSSVSFAASIGDKVCWVDSPLPISADTCIDGKYYLFKGGAWSTNRVTIARVGKGRLFSLSSAGYSSRVNIRFLNLNLDGGYVEGNASAQPYGGMLSCPASGTVTFDNCVVRNCYAEGNGGVLDGYCSVVMRGSTFCDNMSDHMGGVICLNNGSVTADGCTFVGNVGKSVAGVFRVDGSSVFRNCVFTDNSGGDGGVLYGKGSYSFQGCTFTGNKARTYGDVLCTYTYLLPSETLPERSVEFRGCKLQDTGSAREIYLQSDYKLIIQP